MDGGVRRAWDGRREVNIVMTWRSENGGPEAQAPTSRTSDIGLQCQSTGDTFQSNKHTLQL